jgi:ABC-2 type transport system ATP-binding protein
LVVRKRISCRSTLSTDELKTWPDVQTVTSDHDLLQITTSNAEAVVRRLLAADHDLHDLDVRRAGLAEVFTELTQEAA